MKNWLSRPQQIQQANRDIIADGVTTVYVLRSPKPNDEATVGFSDEMPLEQNLRPIDVRMEPPKYRGDAYDLLGFTEDNDVRINDRWFCTDKGNDVRVLRVKYVSYRDGSIEAGLSFE